MSNRFPIELLKDYHVENKYTDREFAKQMADTLAANLVAFKVGAVIKDIKMTPFAILFDVTPDAGVSIKKIKDLRVDLEVQLGAPVEIVGLGAQQYTIKIALKNWNRPIIGLKKILESEEFINNDFVLPIAAGMDVIGKPFVFDLVETPHLLVAGTTGSGKSTFLNDLILSILYLKTPADVQFIMIDPKRVELGYYNGLPHLMMPVVKDSKSAFIALNKAKEEMDRRYQIFSELHVKDIESYNAKHGDKDRLPRIVIIVDEYMDMMDEAPKETEAVITSLSRMARASGIHLILSTQRPSSDVITNSIKANLPCRASFTVVDWRESKVIIDRTGAERLLGNGDMLYSAMDSADPVHAQAAYVSYAEVDSVIDYVKIHS